MQRLLPFDSMHGQVIMHSCKEAKNVKIPITESNCNLYKQEPTDLGDYGQSVRYIIVCKKSNIYEHFYTDNYKGETTIIEYMKNTWNNLEKY